jgi:hypothetical protein
VIIINKRNNVTKFGTNLHFPQVLTNLVNKATSLIKRVQYKDLVILRQMKIQILPCSVKLLMSNMGLKMKIDKGVQNVLSLCIL